MRSRASGGVRHVTINVLGTPEVRWANDLLKPPTQKALAILCYLAVRGQPATRIELTELLWPRGDARNLRTELHRLRHLPGADHWLATEGVIEIRARTDLMALEVAVEQERFADALTCLSAGDLLRDIRPTDAPAFGEWLEVERARVNALMSDALRGRSLALEQEGTLLEALTLIRRLIELDPLDEGAYRAAMRIEYKRGHIQAAQSYFETCRRVLMQEFGLEPLSETVELAHEIERGSGLPDTHLRTPQRRIPATLLRPPVLLGRESEWARMQAASEEGRAIFISGPAGVGKTRLMMDFARSKGRYVLLEGRPGDRAVPLSTLARMLTNYLPTVPEETLPAWVSQELLAIVPHLSTDQPAAPVVGDRLRIHQAFDYLFRLVARQLDATPTDDLHHFDAASLEICNHIMFQMLTETVKDGHSHRVTPICAFRSDEMPKEFTEGIKPFIDSGLIVHVELTPLSVTSARAMLESLEVDRTRGLAPYLQRLTGGNPQLIMETLRGLDDTDELEHGLLENIALSKRIGVIVQTRLTRLSETARRLVETLAVLNQEASHEPLAIILGVSPLDIAEALSELEAAQIFADGAFLHDLFHEAVVQRTPSQVRRLLHRRAAEALSREGAEPARVAHHWHEAGNMAQAVSHWLEAARRYGEVGLHLGALELLKHAAQHAQDAATLHEAQLSLARCYLELGRYQEAREAVEPLLHQPLSPRLAARAFELTASIQLGLGQLAEAAVLAERGSELGSAVGDEELLQRLRLLQARILNRSEQHQEALELLIPLLEELRQDPPSVRLARVLSEVAALHDNLGRSHEALPFHYQALELTHQLGAAHHRVIATNHLVYCLVELGRPEDALALGEAVLASGSYRFSDLLRMNLARAYVALGHHEEAKRLYLHLCEQSTDAALCAAAWARLAEVYHQLNQRAEGKRALQQANEKLRHTDYSRAHARVAIATLRYGTKAQKKAIAPSIEALDIGVLPGYLKDELEVLLEHPNPRSAIVTPLGKREP